MKRTGTLKLIAENSKTGLTLRQKRKSKGLSINWVATAIGVSESLLCYLEKGQRLWSDKQKQDYLKAIGEL
jgi:transcriptional regulator with XRE-family HTH domain